MSREFTIAIVGGGVTGLTAAALMARGRGRDRLRLRVLDAGPRPEAPGADLPLRVSAVSPGSVETLTRAGAWAAVLGGACCAYEHMRVWDAAAEPDGPATLRFDADEFGLPELGFIAANEHLRTALLDAAEDAGVDVDFDTGIAGLGPRRDGTRLELADGGVADADLVVAADGARSHIRTETGIPVDRHAYAQTAFVTHLETERGHARTAWQRFLDDGPLGMLPLADGRVSVVWSTAAERADAAMAADDAALGRMLTEASDGVLGALHASAARATFPLAAQHAREYVRAGIALIGDAAHSIHPLAGQGANLGIADAAALAAVVDGALEAGEHPGDRPVLRRYERQRKAENTLMLHFMTGLNRLFASDSAILGEIRRAGMALFNRGGPARNKIVGVALGAGNR